MSEEFAKRMTAQPHSYKPYRYEGQTVWIKELEYDTVVEPWAKYELKDGGTLKTRQVTSRIFEVYVRDQLTGEFTQVLQPNGTKQILTETMSQIVLSE